MKVRLKDIAELADVSVAAVSMILNNPTSTRFSEKTRNKVLQLAEELNYVPNTVAQSLVSNRTKTIGLIIPDLENPFFSSLAKTIEIEYRKKGYTVIMVNTNEEFSNDLNLIKFLYGRNVDGMLIALSANTYGNETKIIKALDDLSVPFVLMDRTLSNFEGNEVIFNNKKGQYLATKHLIEYGHTNIGYLSVKAGSLGGYHRHRGFEQAMKESNIPIDKELIEYGNFSYEFGYSSIEPIIKKGATAVVAANDLIAYGAIKKMSEMGILVPQDISVVGYDNLEINDMLDIGLSSVEQNTRELAMASIKMLQELMYSNEQRKEKRVVLEPKLVQRSSVKKI